MDHRRLGPTDLQVSRLSLGVATFGSQWGPCWTIPLAEADRIVGVAFDQGINYFDTANVYNRGESESWLGAILHRRAIRDRCIVSTKYGYRTQPRGGDYGGSGRAAMRRSVEGSLRRLRTNYVDLLYLHLWDRVTPIEETLEAATNLVDQGKIRHFALSNVPSWYFAQAHTLAAWRGWTPPVAIQLNYNLLTRALEPEFDSMLDATGGGLVAWGPLANGLLAGRYTVDRKSRTVHGEGRITDALFSTGHVDPHADHVERVLRELAVLSRELGRGTAELAIGWLLSRQRVTSVLLGVSSAAQLEENLRATRDIPREAIERLDRAAIVPPSPPYGFLQNALLQSLVHEWPPGEDK